MTFHLRTTSLRLQLMLVFVTFALFLTAILGWFAYRAARNVIHDTAKRDVGSAAAARRTELLRVLRERHERVDKALKLASILREIEGQEKTADLNKLLQDLVSAEDGNAAQLIYRGTAPITVGDTAINFANIPAPAASQLARFWFDAQGQPYYVVRAESNSGASSLTFLATTQIINKIFVEQEELGKTGETFLTDSQGLRITPLKHPSPSDPNPLRSDKPLQMCLGGQEGEVFGKDYRGVDVIHGFRYMPEIGGGCIMSQIEQSEAFMPVALLRTTIAGSSALFAMLAIVLAFVLARMLARPIDRLTDRVRAIKSGDFDSVDRIEGPSEIQTFAQAFTEMAHALKASRAEMVRLLELEQQARKEAEKANRAKDEFLATVSHELRTPLTSIIGWSQMLRSGKLDADIYLRALDSIERNARSQAQLVEDLLDVARITSGKLRLDIRAVDPVSFIMAAIDAVRPAAEAKAVRVEFAHDGFMDTITCDPDRLQQVVWNLLSNAVKFTPAGGRVDVRLARAGSYFQIIVSDTGQGIRADFLPYIFDRFRQADSASTRLHGGLGLGLAIVRHLVELHGGTIQAESPGEGKGSTFTVQIPLQTAPGPADDTETLPAKIESDIPNFVTLDGVRVLIVDDEADTRDWLRAVLTQFGADVTTVASTADALRTLKQSLPDVLVSDIGMPGEDGYMLIRQVRSLDAAHGGAIPAIALTAYTRAEDRARARAAGYQIHISKPIVTTELIAFIGRLAGRS